MALDSRAAAISQHRENLDYRSDPTGAKANLFLAACEFLITCPEESQGTEGRVRYNHQVLNEQIKRAQEFYSHVSANVMTTVPLATPRQFSMERFYK